MNFFTGQRRALLLAAVIVVGIGNVSDVAAQGAVKTTTFTDKRDGQKYRSVKIGNQVWMAENLRFKIGDSWCYDNDESKCQQYGRLYDWNMAKVACPAGWHLPTKEEWTELVTVVGSSIAGKKLKTKSGWNENGNGTDEYGFSALPGGYRNAVGSFSDAGDFGDWWAATEYWSGKAYYRDMDYSYDFVDEGSNVKGHGFSVRCVAD